MNFWLNDYNSLTYYSNQWNNESKCLEQEFIMSKILLIYSLFNKQNISESSRYTTDELLYRLEILYEQIDSKFAIEDWKAILESEQVQENAISMTKIEDSKEELFDFEADMSDQVVENSPFSSYNELENRFVKNIVRFQTQNFEK